MFASPAGQHSRSRSSWIFEGSMVLQELDAPAAATVGKRWKLPESLSCALQVLDVGIWKKIEFLFTYSVLGILTLGLKNDRAVKYDKRATIKICGVVGYHHVTSGLHNFMRRTASARPQNQISQPPQASSPSQNLSKIQKHDKVRKKSRKSWNFFKKSCGNREEKVGNIIFSA